MMNTRHSTISRAARIAAGSLLALATLGSSVASTLAAGGGSGSVRTTTAACASNSNLYAAGDTVYLHGDNFVAATAYGWTIAGLPGGASGDPSHTVATGTGTTDASGEFCVAAYVVAGDDWGEYTADVNQGSTSKNHNYHVNRPSDATGGTTDPGTGTTDPGTGTIDPGTGTTDPGTGTTDPDTTGTGTTDPGTGTTDTGTGATDTGTGSTDTNTTTDPGNGTTDPGTVTTDPTQQVLGITNSVTQPSSIALPPTDTIGGVSDRTLPALLIAGLAAVSGAAILLAPSRRRTADR
jgi:hypothetical protein